MSAVLDLLNLYIAMAIYYILELPYGIQVIISTVFLYLLFSFLLKLTEIIWPRLKKLFYFWIFPFVIIFLQEVLYLIAKAIPGLRESAESIDENLNQLGLKLGAKLEEENKAQKDKTVKKKVKKYLFRGGLTIAIIFLILPYYLEPFVDGNAKEICKEMTEFGMSFQKKAQHYVDKHYNPTEFAESGRTKKSQKKDKKYVLHLGKKGSDGAYLRKSPKLKQSNILTTVSGDIKLYYENKTKKVGKIVWLKVSTKDVSAAWISKNLIRKKDLRKAGIK